MGNIIQRGLVAAFAVMAVAVPVAAQSYSDSFTFLKAVKERDGTKVQALVTTPGNVVVNARERGSGEAAVHMVARDRDLTWLSFLLGRGARADIQNNQGDTPLALATQLGWTDGAQLLLDRRATVDLPNSRGETPLILAVHRRDVAMIRLLLGSGANPNRTDSIAGYSAIDYAKRDPRAAVILRLLEERPAAPARAISGPSL